jgi:hypothetical protein
MHVALAPRNGKSFFMANYLSGLPKLGVFSVAKPLGWLNARSCWSTCVPFADRGEQVFLRFVENCTVNISTPDAGASERVGD